MLEEWKQTCRYTSVVDVNKLRHFSMIFLTRWGQGNWCSAMRAQAFQEGGELSLKKFPELAQLRQAVRPYSDRSYFAQSLNHGIMVI